MKEIILGLLEEKAYDKLKAVLRYVTPQDLAELLQDLQEEERPEDLLTIFRLLSKNNAAEVFVELSPELQAELIRAYNDTELRAILDRLYLDDTVDLIEEMPESVVRRILKIASAETRKRINEILKYAEDSAGSIMTVEYVALRGGMSAREALETIRETGVNKETVYTCYVVGERQLLLGSVSAKDLLLAKDHTRVADLMIPNCPSVRTDADREEAAAMFEKYDLLALPVVDGEDHLVGIVTVDDAMDVLQEEVTEDIQKMAAITPSEKPYLKTGVWETWRHRIPWLMLMMISATFTQLIISGFEEKLQATVILTAFIPMLMGTGGNCGSQASVSVIRSLSLGEVRLGDFARILWKEFRVALVCALSLAAVCFAKILLIDRWILGAPALTVTVALTVALSLCLTVLISKSVGCLLPLAAKGLGFDPAVTAAPFITTAVDVLALLSFFGTATVLLGI